LSKLSLDFKSKNLSCKIAFLFSKFHISSIYLTILAKNSITGLWANSQACFVNFQFISTANISIGKLCFCANFKPYSSCHGVTLMTHDQLKESTPSSHMIGIFLFIIGIITFCHISFLYLLSCGFTASATSANMVSILVVGTTILIHFASIKYFILYSYNSIFSILILFLNRFV
jgi:hypothetical protein